MYCESDLYLFLPNLIIYTCTQVITEAFKKKMYLLIQANKKQTKNDASNLPFLDAYL